MFKNSKKIRDKILDRLIEINNELIENRMAGRDISDRRHSSNIKKEDCLYNALAMPILCCWPPLNLTPFSPTTV